MTTSTTLRRSGFGPLRRGIDAFPLTGGRPAERIPRFRTISDLFEKRWMEGAVPLVLALALGGRISSLG